MKFIGKAKAKAPNTYPCDRNNLLYPCSFQDSHSRPHLSVHLSNTQLLLDHQEMNQKIKITKKCLDVVDRFVCFTELLRNVRKAFFQCGNDRTYLRGAEGWQKSQSGRAHASMGIRLADYLVKLRVGSL